jgi:hypothetical protein
MDTLLEGGPLPNRGRTTISTELRSIIRSVGSIQDALTRLIPVLASAPAASAAGPAAPAPRRKLNLSPQRKAALKLQGQYMGYLRGLKPRQQARVKALAAAKGIRTAVGLAQKLAKK